MLHMYKQGLRKATSQENPDRAARERGRSLTIRGEEKKKKATGIQEICWGKLTEKPKHEQKRLQVLFLVPRVQSSRPGERCPTNEAVHSPGSRTKAVRKFEATPQPHCSLIPVPTALEDML